MKKPIRKVRRTTRREFGRKGKGKGKGKRRRLHGRGVLAFLASLPDPEYEEILFGKGKVRVVKTLRVKVRDLKVNQMTKTVKQWNATYVEVLSISAGSAPKATGRVEVHRQRIWLEPTTISNTSISRPFSLTITTQSIS